jgi:hypothetical protein
MTEDEWRSGVEPEPMLAYVRYTASERKLRLFACACCRRVWHLLTDERSTEAIEVAERFAEGEATAAELAEAERRHNEVVHCGVPSLEQAAPWLIHWAIDPSLDEAFRWIFRDDDDIAFLRDAEAPAQAALLRDIVGDPLSFVALGPAWLRWNNGLVRRLAQAVYDERHLPLGTLDLTRLAILADALEEAGCTDAAILEHCRSAGDHVRGCWVVDLLLGKE